MLLTGTGAEYCQPTVSTPIIVLGLPSRWRLVQQGGARSGVWSAGIVPGSAGLPRQTREKAQ